MSFPNFVIGGVSAGGTSFLASILKQHENIYFPKEIQPEPHYYFKSSEYKKGKNYYLERWFKDVPKTAIAIGERSSSYLYGGKNVAKKIASDFPDLKLIFVLRNPSERAWANYRFTVLQGLEEYSFEDALKFETERKAKATGIWAEIQPHDYTGRGFYANQINQYLEYFDKKNILLVKSELLSSQTDVELKKILNFLGLSSNKFKYVRSPNYSAVNVINPYLQTELRKYFCGRFDKVVEGIRKKESLKQFIFNDQDKLMVSKLLNNLSPKINPMPEECRSYLLKVFRNSNDSLCQYVDFDVSDWS